MFPSRLSFLHPIHQRAEYGAPNTEYLQYATLHEIKLVEGSLTSLKLALSDQNLELLPDYNSRVDVLKNLKFIDDNSTVLLKGRVACEVSLSHLPSSSHIEVLYSPADHPR